MAAHSAYNKFDIPEAPFRITFFLSGAIQWHLELIHSKVLEINLYSTTVFFKILHGEHYRRKCEKKKILAEIFLNFSSHRSMTGSINWMRCFIRNHKRYDTNNLFVRSYIIHFATDISSRMYPYDKYIIYGYITCWYRVYNNENSYKSKRIKNKIYHCMHEWDTS